MNTFCPLHSDTTSLRSFQSLERAMARFQAEYDKIATREAEKAALRREQDEKEAKELELERQGLLILSSEEKRRRRREKRKREQREEEELVADVRDQFDPGQVPVYLVPIRRSRRGKGKTGRRCGENEQHDDGDTDSDDGYGDWSVTSEEDEDEDDEDYDGDTDGEGRSEGMIDDDILAELKLFVASLDRAKRVIHQEKDDCEGLKHSETDPDVAKDQGNVTQVKSKTNTETAKIEKGEEDHPVNESVLVTLLGSLPTLRKKNKKKNGKQNKTSMAQTPHDLQKRSSPTRSPPPEAKTFEARTGRRRSHRGGMLLARLPLLRRNTSGAKNKETTDTAVIDASKPACRVM